MPQPEPALTDHDMALFRQGTTEDLVVLVTNPLDRNDKPKDLLPDDDTAGRLEIVDDGDNTIVDVTFGKDGNDVDGVVRIGLGAYRYVFDTTDGALFNSTGTYLAFWTFRAGTPDRLNSIRKRQLIRVVPNRYFRLIDTLSLMLDKSRKSLVSQHMTGRRSAAFGYSDAMYSVYLDMSASLINTVPPYTNLSVMSVTDADLFMLIQGAVIIGLECQQIFAVDTDYAYSLGGNSLTLDHVSKIGQVYGSPLVSQFFDLLKRYKWRFTSGGTVLVQMQYSYSIGRFFSEVPSGFFSRWGLGIGPTGIAPGVGT